VLYEVLITACLIASPGSCMQFDVPVKTYPSIKSCAKHGQFDVLRWLDRKPEWQIDKWTCTGSGETI
jgi:hypothetical protein